MVVSGATLTGVYLLEKGATVTLLDDAAASALLEQARGVRRDAERLRDALQQTPRRGRTRLRP